MSRRGQILLYSFLTVMWGFNTFTNWWMYTWGRSQTLTTMAAVNMVLMPVLMFLSLGQIWKLVTAPKPEIILDPHATIMIEESLVVRVCRWLALAVFTGAGIWGMVRGDSRFGTFSGISLFSILILGIGVWGLVALTLNPRQRLILTPQSLTDSRLRPTTLPWDELADIQTKQIWGSTVLTLVLRDSREFRGASVLARWRRIDKLKVNPITFGVDADVLRRGFELRRNVFTF